MAKFSELMKLFKDLLKDGEAMGLNPEKVLSGMKTYSFLAKPAAALMTMSKSVLTGFIECNKFVFKNLFKGDITNVINATGFVISSMVVISSCLSKDLDKDEKWTLGLSEFLTWGSAAIVNKYLGKWFKNFTKKTTFPALQNLNPVLRQSKYSRTWGDAVQIITSTAIYRYGSPVFAAPLAVLAKKKFFDTKRKMNKLDELDSGVREIDFEKTDLKAIRINILEDQKKILKKDLDLSMMKKTFPQQPVVPSVTTVNSVLPEERTSSQRKVISVMPNINNRTAVTRVNNVMPTLSIAS